MYRMVVFVVILAVVSGSLAGAQPAGEPYLVKDVQTNLGHGTGAAGDPRFLGINNNAIYFAADTLGSGWELWKTDGTAGGCAMVQDICPGPGGAFYYSYSLSSYLGSPNGTTAIFNPYTDHGPCRLWACSGGQASELANITAYPNSCATSLKQNLTGPGVSGPVLNGFLYFFADDGVHGIELWRTDGTAERTMMVKDLNPGSGGCGGDAIAVVGDRVLFSATGVSGGMKLWATDGTAAGTVLVKDVSLASDSGITFYTLTGNKLFFTAWEGSTVKNWVTDGTPGGTLPLDVDCNINSAVVGDKVYLNKWDSATGYELWATDGTAGGSHLVKDVAPGPASGSPWGLTACNNAVYFIASDSTHGLELWKSDGTAAGTSMLMDTTGGPTSGTLRVHPMAVGNTLYFVALDGGGIPALWKSDGTEGGTIMVANIPGADSMYFVGATQDSVIINNRAGLWMSDGTTSGTRQIVPNYLAPTAVGEPSINRMFALGKQVFFNAYYVGNGTEYNLWQSDGTAEGTGPLSPSRSYYSEGGARNFIANGNRLYYYENGMPWSTDGTEAGTVQFSVPGRENWNYYWHPTLRFVPYGDQVLFPYYPTSRFEIWKTDGTTSGTSLFVSGTYNIPSDQALQAVAVGRKVYFMSDVLQNSFYLFNRLWVSDGGSTPTLVKEFSPTGIGKTTYMGAYFSQLTSVNGTLFFCADDGVHGAELWTSQGTAASTMMVKDISVGSSYTLISKMTPSGGKLYFLAQRPGGTKELWVSDGTAAGTQLVFNINPDSDAGNPDNLTDVSGTLYFTVESPETGRELWRTNGTFQTTLCVKYFDDGAPNFSLANLVNAGGVLYFTASDPAHGVELWMSTGTDLGTRRLTDISPGPLSSNPALLTYAGHRLFFTAIDGTTNEGQELWAIDLAPRNAVKGWQLYRE